MSSFEQLGAAERYAAEKLVSAIEKARVNAHALAEMLDEIDADHVQERLLDSVHKESVLTMIDPLDQLGQRLGESQILVKLAEIVLKP